MYRIKLTLIINIQLAFIFQFHLSYGSSVYVSLSCSKKLQTFFSMMTTTLDEQIIGMLKSLLFSIISFSSCVPLPEAK